MRENQLGVKTRLLKEQEEMPYELLLLADETKEAIDKYVMRSNVFVAYDENSIKGVYVLYPLNEFQMEIKNIAVATQLQGRGIGKFLLRDAEYMATKLGYQELIVGTPENSHGLLRFYEKAGFSKYDRRINFYIDNYPKPIIENGEQLKNMILLRKSLKPD